MVLEFSQLLIRSEQNFTNELDEACAKSAAEYQRRISIAASEHERVREGAELEVKRLALEQELEQKKREEAARREVEKQQRELEKIEEEKEKAKREEQERQRRAEAKKREEEAARQASEQQRQREEAEARLKAQRDQEEAARKSQLQQQEAAAAARKAQEQEAQKARLEAAKAPLPAAQPSPAPVPSTSTASGPAATAAGSADVENIHSRYLALHMRMKEFWKPFRKSCAQPGNPLKGPVGDLRRDIRKTTGQVTVRREDSKVVITKLRDILRRSRAAGGPTVDIRPFIISHPPPTLADESEAQYPAILLYAFICFEKFVVKQFDQEAANEEGRIIQELGAIAASLFMDKEFAWQGIPLTDLLLAKYHRVCPILFGVTGDLKSSEGRARLGWLPVSGGQISTNDYHQRMVGLAAGYAAFTLRHVATPALPISEYWRALASICNTPADKLYSGHFMVMKGLVKDSARKVLLFYGAQGRALLRQATIVMPRRAPPHASESATLVSVLPEVWKTLGISLE
jgi:nucleoporin GLE1